MGQDEVGVHRAFLRGNQRTGEKGCQSEHRQAADRETQSASVVLYSSDCSLQCGREIRENGNFPAIIAS